MKTPRAVKEKGSAVTLDRLENEEQRLYTELETARDMRDAAQASLRDGDPASEALLSKYNNALLFAYEAWMKVSKVLLSFDKGVAPEKREGEKIPKAETERIITMLIRHVRLSIEQAALSFAQDGILCSSETDLYQLSANRFRSQLSESMKTANREEQLPNWVSDAVNAGL